MWIGLYYQPISMTVVQIDGIRDPEMIEIDGKIFEKVTTSLNKKENPCKNYDLDDSEFNSCCKSLFTEFVINSNNCTIPGLIFILKQVCIHHVLFDIINDWHLGT